MCFFRMNICSQSLTKFKMSKPDICLLISYEKIKTEIKPKSQTLEFLCKLFYAIYCLIPNLCLYSYYHVDLA